MSLTPANLTPYFEIPISGDPAELIKSVAETEARAKVRTGGVTADSFPSSFDLARFITEELTSLNGALDGDRA